MHNILPPFPAVETSPAVSPQSSGANRGLAVSQMLLPRAGKHLQALPDLLRASRTCFGTRVTSLLCCTMSVPSLGRLGVIGVPKWYFFSVLTLLL